MRAVILCAMIGCRPATDEPPPIEDSPGAVVDEPVLVDDPPGDPTCERYAPPAPGPSRLSAGSLRPQRIAEVDRPGYCHVMEDLDGDGYVDLVFGEDAGPQPRLVWMWGRPDGGLDRVDLPIPDPARQCVAFDQDHDGALELVYVLDAGLYVVDGLDARAPSSTQVARDVRGLDAGSVYAMALVALDGPEPDDLLIAVGGEANVCVAPEVDPEGDGDVILPSDPISPGRVVCLVAHAASWRVGGEDVCPPGLDPTPTSFPFVLSLQDLDDDAIPELLATGDIAPNVMLRRDAGGAWSDISASTGFGSYNHAMGVAWADLDGDGLRDAWVTDYGPDQLRWNQGCLQFFEAEQAFGIAELTAQTISWGVVAADLDLDGDEDVVVAQSIEAPPGRLTESVCALEQAGLPIPPVLLMANDGGGRFQRFDVPGPAGGPATAMPNHLTAGDLDGDGAIDLLNTDRDYGAMILRNRTSGRGHYVAVRPVRADGGAAWGARVVIDDGRGERARELHLTTSTTGQG
ncbi:MAG TPA: VCBS repeat-containing protein, partial [Myxococcota bacterium]|nr:VCBS repeat-containing protein [Myxococcota bacterium]